MVRWLFMHIKLGPCYMVAILELIIRTCAFIYHFFPLESGRFQVVNHHLLKDLTELGLWDETMKHKLIAYGGSVQVREGAGNEAIQWLYCSCLCTPDGIWYVGGCFITRGYVDCLLKVKGMMLVMGNYGIRVRNGKHLLCTCMCTHQFVYPSYWWVGYVGRDFVWSYPIRMLNQTCDNLSPAHWRDPRQPKEAIQNSVGDSTANPHRHGCWSGGLHRPEPVLQCAHCWAYLSQANQHALLCME